MKYFIFAILLFSQKYIYSNDSRKDVYIFWITTEIPNSCAQGVEEQQSECKELINEADTQDQEVMRSKSLCMKNNYPDILNECNKKEKYLGNTELELEIIGTCNIVNKNITCTYDTVIKSHGRIIGDSKYFYYNAKTTRISNKPNFYGDVNYMEVTDGKRTKNIFLSSNIPGRERLYNQTNINLTAQIYKYYDEFESVKNSIAENFYFNSGRISNKHMKEISFDNYIKSVIKVIDNSSCKYSFYNFYNLKINVKSRKYINSTELQLLLQYIFHFGVPYNHKLCSDSLKIISYIKNEIYKTIINDQVKKHCSSP